MYLYIPGKVIARLLLLNGKPTVPGFWFELNINCVFKIGELKTKFKKIICNILIYPFQL